MPSEVKLGCGVVVALVVILTIILSIVIIPAGNVGVITQFGAVNRVVQPGLSLKIPFVEGVVTMNVQVQKWEGPMDAASSDLQTVTTTASVNFHLKPECAATVYQKYGTGYVNNLLVPTTLNAVKTITAKHPIDQLIRDRETPRAETQTSLTDSMAPYCIIIDMVNMTDFNPSEEYAKAIEAKQVAQQQAEQAKQVLAKAQIDAQTAAAQAKGQADAQVIQAQADAQSIQLRGQALQANPLVIQYDFVQNLKNVTWGIMPDTGISPLLPIPTK